MNTILKTAIVGVLALGGSSAFALTSPESGSSDLVLVVNNTVSGATYALDTGISIDSVLPTGSLVAGAKNNTTIAGVTSTIQESSTLSTFLSSNPASGDLWTIEAGQYAGTATIGSDQTPGVAKVIFTSTAFTVTPSNANNKNLTNLNTFENGLDQDVIQSTGGLNQLTTVSETGTATYSAGAKKKYNFETSNTSGALGSGALDLFGFTANSGPGVLENYILGTVTLSTSGVLTITGNTEGSGTPPPVPLPAAVWLFGSGLLGLVGVSRRRKTAA